MIDLPEATEGTFSWKGREYSLVSGHQILMMESENSFARHKYYVSSSSGNDTNDGLTPERAFKTLKRVSEEKLSPGDSLLLKSR